ncbi:LOW QUALITY PROTEIN: ubiquitin carboxyl-terminal hydrolase 2-like [Salvia miltiorrhiza]|uniref:LOW QUALITY PROTEIN: ubiquitin carboxyl-terminal hydrolase 2-like n=1 Tax=Salvia miltiorrhiza TaxID=226208 RepID=UPI0025ACD668|nr:LOW QUALITY PROTEIN: ubiquitin carboxyl-terminal hydrolase 2-like [Salvia miltiorrhiza]
MGKKVKKKVRSGPKEKRGPSMSPVTVPQDVTSNAETPANGVVVTKDRGVCSHVDKGINLDKLSAKLRSSGSAKCEDCRGNVADRRAKKGQGKHGKKGGAKSETRAIWVCLECGHYACGGVGLPTTPQSHAVRHSKQNHHPLVVHYENHQLLWCFPCDKLVLCENSEDHKHKEALNEVVKMLKGQPGEGSSLDVEDVWFGSASVTSTVKLDYSVSTNGKAVYSIRGLSNLGNTCFFNSVLQNLFAIKTLRDYFFKLDESVGPLSAAMRKLFLETSNEGGSKGVINPRSLFGSLCTKSPQFRGFQQHDSHELLRCLLDGMSTEELSFRKHTKSCEVSVKDPTFVDVVFGGQLSSTVSCLECGHTSTIYEPFLDLSLPVPTKKPPPKRNQPPLRGKKPKLPPKRTARNLSKVSKEANSLPRKSVFDQSTSGNSSDEVHSNVALDMGLSAEHLSAFQNPENQPVDQAVGEQTISSDVLTWLDFLDPSSASEEVDAASEIDDTSAINDLQKKMFNKQDASSSVTSDFRIESNLENQPPEIPLDNTKNYVVAQEQNAALQFEDEQSIKPNSDGRILPKGSLTEDCVECDGGKDQRSPSCSQICVEDSSTSRRDDDDSSQNLDPKVMSPQNQEAATSSIEVTRTDTGVSSAIVGNEQESLDFDGFGDLFNEPEESSGAKPSDNPGSVAKNGVNGNTSESDADEVDNADAPVTVESCLSFFTKPEFLSKDEHAWQCDNCSRILREQRAKLRKLKEPISDAVANGCEDRHPSGLLGDEKTCDMEKSMNGNAEVDPSDGGSLPHNEEIFENGKGKVGNHVGSEINGTEIQSENVELQATNTCPGFSECSNLRNRSLDPDHGECDSEKDGSAESDLQSVKHESAVREHEDLDSEKLKVKRDATKSILISKAPTILTIHLKRFSQDARGRLSKLNGHVSFRETIHLKPYMDPRCSKDSCTPPYRLVGVVEHLGTMRGGHYVAYVRSSNDYGDDGTWYHASDAYVRQASLDEVLRCEAYILFYERT